MTVLIVGAGPAGLVLAILLAERGVAFRIVDAKPGPVAESRAAIVHVRTLELLDRLGLAERAIAMGVKTTRVEIYERGRRAGGFPLAGADSTAGSPGAADGQGAADGHAAGGGARAKGGRDSVGGYDSVGGHGLVGGLHAAGWFAVAGRRAETLTRFPFALGLEQDRTERLLADRLAELGHEVEWNTRLDSINVDGSTWIVGADGARSTVRRALGIGFEGSTYPQTGLLADVELADVELAASGTGTAIPAGTIRLNLTKGGFAGLFRLGSGRYRLFGAVPPELMTESGDAYSTVDIEQIQRWFDTYFGIDARLVNVDWTALFRIHSRLADRFRRGNAFLIGDAAHIHSPAGGQGMNLAIGDAFNLGWKLALVATGQAHERLLDSYEAERMPVARAVLRWADRGFALETMRHPAAVWAREHLAARLIGPLSRLPAVRRRVFRLFSQTWIGYRDSPAVAGRRTASGPRPGDRFPDPPPSMVDTVDTRYHLILQGDHDLTAAEQLLSRFTLDVGIHHLPGATRRVTLIRPDGHVAFTAPDTTALESYLDTFFMRHDNPASGQPA